MLTTTQRIRLQIYRRAAALPDPEYRRLLARASGLRSSKDGRWTNRQYDRAMAMIEAAVFDAVAAGTAPDPIAAGSKWIQSKYYWRRKLAPPGKISTRQIHAIEAAWKECCAWLPADARNMDYFTGVVRRATGRQDVGRDRLSSADADHVIEALRSLLARLIKTPKQTSRQVVCNQDEPHE